MGELGCPHAPGRGEELSGADSPRAPVRAPRNESGWGVTWKPVFAESFQVFVALFSLPYLHTVKNASFF